MAVLVPAKCDEEATVCTEVFARLTDSLDTEACGIALALDMSIQYLAEPHGVQLQSDLFVMCDCKAAIDLVRNRSVVNHNVQVLTRISAHLRSLQSMNVKVSLVWIPSHCDIVYNDLGDSSAKAAIKDADDITTTAALTTNACKNMINKQCHQLATQLEYFEYWQSNL